jgi:hypothetical protein
VIARIVRVLNRGANPARLGGLVACVVFAAALFLGFVPLSVDSHGYWVDFIPLPVRIAMAAGLVVWAARADRRWVVPVTATLALPVVYLNGLALLVAAPYLWTRDRARRSVVEPTAETSGVANLTSVVAT